jgi:hypothetical protein
MEGTLYFCTNAKMSQTSQQLKKRAFARIAGHTPRSFIRFAMKEMIRVRTYI